MLRTNSKTAERPGARSASAQIIQALSKYGYDAAEYKAKAALFGRITPPEQKAIANRAERAHGKVMSKTAGFPVLPIDAGCRS
jgi:hypothetical protein